MVSLPDLVRYRSAFGGLNLILFLLGMAAAPFEPVPRPIHHAVVVVQASAVHGPVRLPLMVTFMCLPRRVLLRRGYSRREHRRGDDDSGKDRSAAHGSTSSARPVNGQVRPLLPSLEFIPLLAGDRSRPAARQTMKPPVGKPTGQRRKR